MNIDEHPLVLSCLKLFKNGFPLIFLHIEVRWKQADLGVCDDRTALRLRHEEDSERLERAYVWMGFHVFSSVFLAVFLEMSSGHHVWVSFARSLDVKGGVAGVTQVTGCSTTLVSRPRSAQSVLKRDFGLGLSELVGTVDVPWIRFVFLRCSLMFLHFFHFDRLSKVIFLEEDLEVSPDFFSCDPSASLLPCVSP